MEKKSDSSNALGAVKEIGPLTLLLVGLVVLIYFARLSLLPKSEGRNGSANQGADLNDQGYPPPLQDGTLMPVPSPEAPGATPVAVTNWEPLPACQNQPQDMQHWRQEIAKYQQDPTGRRQLEAYLLRMKKLSKVFSKTSADELQEIINMPDDAAQNRVVLRTIAAIELNLVVGNLSTATEIIVPDLPNVRTVADLLAQLEQSLDGKGKVDHLIGTSARLLNGELISKSVCTQFIYPSQKGLKNGRWASDGLSLEESRHKDLPPVVEAISPDYSKILIVTSDHPDSGGGPVLLYDLNTSTSINLNEKLGIPISGPAGMSSGGWHPDGKHVLLLDGENQGVHWVDVDQLTYQLIPLSKDTFFNANANKVRLSPDGSMIAYQTFPNDEMGPIVLYDIEKAQIVKSIDLPPDRGYVHALRFSPQGDFLAIQVQKETDDLDPLSIGFVDIKTGDYKEVVSDVRDWSELAWSPDGDAIAFENQDDDGSQNIWLASIQGKVSPLTRITGEANDPIWSQDGRFVYFVTLDREIGMTSKDGSGKIWHLGRYHDFWPSSLALFSLP